MKYAFHLVGALLSLAVICLACVLLGYESRENPDQTNPQPKDEHPPS